MTGTGPHNAGDILTLGEAIEIYAERDWRRSDADKGKLGIRGAEDRARKAIVTAVESGALRAASEDGKSFRRDYFAFWASSSEPTRKGIEWAGDFASVKWSERFEGLYQAGPLVVRSFELECDFTYPKWSLLEPIPTPSVEAPREWVEALAFSKSQNDALRNRIAELESEVAHLKLANSGRKGGLSKGL